MVEDFDDLHLDARLLLDQHHEPRSVTEAAVALEAAGYTPQAIRQRGFTDVFELAAAALELTQLYHVPDRLPSQRARGGIRKTAGDLATGWWQGVPWALAFLMLFLGRVALWSSLTASPGIASVVSLAFFAAAVPAGAVSQSFIRKGTFYFLQGNFILMRWALLTGIFYGSTTAVLVIGLTDVWYIIPHYGPRLSGLFIQFSLAIFLFLISGVPLCVLRRLTRLVAATAAGLIVDFVLARTLGAAATTSQRTEVLIGSMLAGSLVITAVSVWAVYRVTRRSAPARGRIRPPETRVVLWQLLPYAGYGIAYSGLVLADRLSVGIAYGRALGTGAYLYPSTYEGAVDLGLLNLIFLAGFGSAFAEAWGRYFARTLRRFTLGQWPRLRRRLWRAWVLNMLAFAVIAAGVALTAPGLYRAFLPRIATVSLHQPGGMQILHFASLGYALLPLGAMCCQQLFAFRRFRAPLIAAASGALVNAGLAGFLASQGRISMASLGLPAGAATYLLISAGAVGWAQWHGEETLYGAF